MSDNADFIAKLQQIEEMASALGAQLEARAKTRAQHIALLARVLRGRLELADAGASPGDAGEGPHGPQTKPPR